MNDKLENVKLFLFDLDGTVYLGDKEIPGSYAAIRTLRDMGKKVCVFTNNSSRTHDDYVERLNKMGLGVGTDEVYTSGEVTCEFLKENFNGKRVFLLGNERLKKEFADECVEVVEENPDMVVLAFDTSLTYRSLYTFCKYVAEGLPYIATHPDNFCPSSDGPMPDAGALIEAVRLTTGRSPDYIMGKPHCIAGERIAKKFNLAQDEIAMVGDRLYTDIAFAQNCGFVSVLVLSGETDIQSYQKSGYHADYVFDAVRDIPSAIR